jgi:hypothetical protein
VGSRPPHTAHVACTQRVCKLYLCGLCPHDVFSKTKMEIGACEKIHSDQLKEEYEAKRAEGRDYGYEYELEKVLKDYIHEIDRKITKGHKVRAALHAERSTVKG